MFEIIDSLLDLLRSNLEYVNLFTITEELTEGSVDDLSAAVQVSHLEIGGVKYFFPRLLRYPLLVADEPGASGLPHAGVGQEVFGKTKQLFVICCFLAN